MALANLALESENHTQIEESQAVRPVGTLLDELGPAASFDTGLVWTEVDAILKLLQQPPAVPYAEVRELGCWIVASIAHQNNSKFAGTLHWSHVVVALCQRDKKLRRSVAQFSSGFCLRIVSERFCGCSLVYVNRTYEASDGRGRGAPAERSSFGPLRESATAGVRGRPVPLLYALALHPTVPGLVLLLRYK